jgi:hypothetical protein
VGLRGKEGLCGAVGALDGAQCAAVVRARYDQQNIDVIAKVLLHLGNLQDEHVKVSPCDDVPC